MNVNEQEVKTETQQNGTMQSENATVFWHQRGLRACILDSWQVFASRPWRYLLQLLPGAALAGAGLAWLAWSITKIVATFVIPARLYIAAGNEKSQVWAYLHPQFADFVLPIVSLIVAVACCFAGKGLLWEQIARYATTGRLQEKKFIAGKSMAKMTGRVLSYNMTVFAASLVPVAIIIVCSEWMQIRYLYLLMVPILLFVFPTAVPGRVASLVNGDRLIDSLKFTWKDGIRHWGGYFIVTLLTAIPLVAAGAAVLLPYAPYSLGTLADAENIVLGEHSGLPEYYTALNLVTAFLCFTAFTLLTTLQTWTLALKGAGSKSAGRFTSDKT